MNPLRETCHCGHDKSSHYQEYGVRPGTKPGACLCLGCNDCKKYVNENDPKPLAPVERPAHRGDCQCYRCKKWREYVRQLGVPGEHEERDTDPYLFGLS